MQSQPFAIEMAGLTKQFGRHRAVVVFYLAVSIAVAAIVFRKRDIVGIG